MRKLSSLLLLALVFFSSSSVFAAGPNAQIDSLYHRFVLLEGLWERDDAQYTQEAHSVGQLLDQFEQSAAAHWIGITRDRKIQLIEMNFKLAEFFAHQRNPKFKGYKRVLQESSIRLPEVSLEHLRWVEKFFGKYLDLVGKVLWIQEFENPLAVKAYYFRATARSIIAEYELDRFHELAGATSQEKALFARNLVTQFRMSSFEFQRALLLNQAFHLPFTIAEDLENTQALLLRARALQAQFPVNQE